MPNQAGILAESAVGRCMRREIRGEVGEMRLCYSMLQIMFSDIADSIKSIALGQDQITIL